VLVNVTQKSRGEFVATLFELVDGRVIVTDSTSADRVGLFASEQAWAQANTPHDAIETYDSVTDAFLDVLPSPEPIA